MPRPQPSEASVQKIRKYVELYWEKSGTVRHPDSEVTEAVVRGPTPARGREGRSLS